MDLNIYEGCSPREQAEQFCAYHELDSQKLEMLTSHIYEQLKLHYSNFLKEETNTISCPEAGTKNTATGMFSRNSLDERYESNLTAEEDRDRTSMTTFEQLLEDFDFDNVSDDDDMMYSVSAKQIQVSAWLTRTKSI